jgi:hypothetical protein
VIATDATTTLFVIPPPSNSISLPVFKTVYPRYLKFNPSQDRTRVEILICDA